MTRRVIWGIAVSLVLLASSAAPAGATLPGPNGKIAFMSDRAGNWDIWTMNADGTQPVGITGPASGDFYPAWSPDGRDIAFARGPHLFAMDANGGDRRQLTTTASGRSSPTWSPDASKLAYGYQATRIAITDASGGGTDVPITQPPGAPAGDGWPDWAPDGDRIAFQRFWAYPGGGNFSNLMVVDPDGSNETPLTSGSTFVDQHPSISPDGGTVLFERRRNVASGGGWSELYTVPIGGGTPAQLTDTPGVNEEHPVWSPDGSKIAFDANDPSGNWDIYVMDADGTDPVRLTTDPGADTQPNWQRVAPTPGFPRPKGATPMRLSLVPAYKECAAPNRTHGPPLAFGSCAPPDQASDFATVGTPNANANAAQSTGHLLLSTLVGNPATEADEADVAITMSITDVRNRADPSTGYPWSLHVRLPIRLTDKDVGCCGVAGTTMDFSAHDEGVGFDAPCAPAGASIGSTCAVTTTADSLIPGAVPEGKRNLWQLTDPVRVYDAGPDGHASSTDDNTLFAVQGVFVP